MRRLRTGLSPALLLALIAGVGTARHATAASPLEVGVWAEAAVRPDSLRGWVTDEIDLKGGGRDYDGALTGILESRTADAVVLLGRRILVDGATACKDSTGENLDPGALRPGEHVEVRLVRRGRALLATRIKRRPPGESEVEGVVESLDLEETRRMALLGFELALGDSVRVRSPKRRPEVVRGLASDDDLAGRELLALGPLHLTAVAGVSLDPNHNYDLDAGEATDQTKSDFSGRVEAWARFGDRLRGFGRVSTFGRLILEDQKGTRDGVLEASFDEAWFLASGLLRPELALQVGRQRVLDRHEWLSDAYLDAVRLHLSSRDTWGELSASTRYGAVTTENTETWNVMAALNRSLDRNFDVGAYAIHREAHPGRTGGRRTWSGVRLLQLRAGRFFAWGEMGWLRGRDRGYELKGKGIHLSGGLLLSRARRLRLNVQYARGSGDRKLGDGIDGNYRQTGLADNNDRFGGVTRFRFYGELFRPELSNLEVVSAGIGIRPTSASSIDLLAHRYRQIVPLPFQNGVDIDEQPLGRDTRLGHEIDLVAGIREIRNLKIEAVIGLFRAGSAFANRSETARTSRLQIDVSF